jgi:hypothetical protein
MLNAVCTIVTPDYFPFALALIKSFGQFGEYQYFVHISSSNRTDFKPSLPLPPNTELLFNEDLCHDGIGKKIFDKYSTTHMDAFRWSMKSVLMHHILLRGKAKKCIYADCDLHFFNDPSFLFSELDSSAFLVIPHWRSSNPHIDTNHFMLLYTDGLYNGGFTAANQNALDILIWWATACEFICEIKQSKGMYVDQSHLNLIPVYFENVKIIRHKGCNVAWWNFHECKRSKGNNGEVLINETFPIVFIHFTGNTIRTILKGDDHLLLPYLKQYADSLQENGWKKNIIDAELKTIVKKEEWLKKNRIRLKIKSVLKNLVQKSKGN